MKVWVICCESDGQPDEFMKGLRVFVDKDTALNYRNISKVVNRFDFVVKEATLELTEE